MKTKLFARYRYSLILLRELVITDFKLRYQDSLLGYLWALLRPLFLFAIIYVVFVYILKIGKGVEHWAVALLLGMMLWSFFTEITKQGLKAIVKNGGIIRKINFPKYIIVIATSLSALINLSINLIVIVIFAISNHVPFTWNMLWVFPIIVEIYFFALGLAFLLGTLNVKYRDVDYIWDIVTQGLFYGSAIMFPITEVVKHSKKMAELLLLNPICQAISDARHLAVNPRELPMMGNLTDNILLIVAPFVITLLIFVFGALYFRARSPYFAEDI